MMSTKVDFRSVFLLEERKRTYFGNHFGRFKNLLNLKICPYQVNGISNFKKFEFKTVPERFEKINILNKQNNLGICE